MSTHHLKSPIINVAQRAFSTNRGEANFQICSLTDQHNEETDKNGVGELAYGKSLGFAMNGAEFCRDEVICPVTVDNASVSTKIINVSS